MEVDEIIKICEKIYTKGCYYYNAYSVVVDNYRNPTYLVNPTFHKYNHKNYKETDVGIGTGNGIVYWNGHFAELCDSKGNVLPFPEGIFPESDLEQARKVIYAD